MKTWTKQLKKTKINKLPHHYCKQEKKNLTLWLFVHFVDEKDLVKMNKTDLAATI